MSADETNGPDYEILTHRFVASQQWDRALASSLDWLRQEPDNFRAHRMAAHSLVNLDRETEAQHHLERALAGDPRDDLAHRWMSMVQFNKRQFKAADESIRQAIELNPLDPYHWYHLGWMSYRQGDLATAGKYVAKALDLNPRDPDILNLQILCTPDSPKSAVEKIRRYEEALALDPENANIHNNMGSQYLNVLKDFAKAEECYRRALFFEPSSKLFRNNLLTTVKHRDWVYRALCAPKLFIFRIIGNFQSLQKKSILLFILLIPIWLIFFRVVLGGLIWWFLLVWPVMKVYEYLTIGDMLARMGELGAKKGGFLGYRQWPLKLRVSIFAFFLLLFWGAVAFLFLSDTVISKDENRHTAISILVSVGVIVILTCGLSLKMRGSMASMAARRRSRRMEDILAPGKPKRSWWRIFTANPNPHE